MSESLKARGEVGCLKARGEVGCLKARGEVGCLKARGEVGCLKARAAFGVVAAWYLLPRGQELVGDRVVWRKIKAMQLRRAHTGLPTVGYRTHYRCHFDYFGVAAPAEAKMLVWDPALQRTVGAHDRSRIGVRTAAFIPLDAGSGKTLAGLVSRAGMVVVLVPRPVSKLSRNIALFVRWPKTTREFSIKLRRTTPQLTLHGLIIEFGKKGGERPITITSATAPES